VVQFLDTTDMSVYVMGNILREIEEVNCLSCPFEGGLSVQFRRERSDTEKKQ